MKWWLEKPMRMLQTNLREIDPDTLNPDDFVKSLQDYLANVVLFNVGGIVANYPSTINEHYHNPFLNKDIVDEIIKKTQKNGIKFIARFDFSKVHESQNIDEKNFYVSSDGRYMAYNGLLQTCINSRYQKEIAPQILFEVLERYPIDGVFFNYGGYVTKDYSNNYYGICHCENCKKLFRNLYSMDLPVKEDGNNPKYRYYTEFKESTLFEHYSKLRELVNKKRPNIAFFNVFDSNQDVYRREAGSSLNNTLGWPYTASMNVKMGRTTWNKIAVSNGAVNFTDIAFRHSSVLPALSAMRLSQSIANGGWLDYYVIGHMSNQEDKTCLQDVKRIFSYHNKNEKYFANGENVASVCLIVPNERRNFSNLIEARGLYEMLAQNHILFDVLHESALKKSDFYQKIEKYDLIIFSDIKMIRKTSCLIIDAYVKNGGKVLSTGKTATLDDKYITSKTVNLQCAGVEEIKYHYPQKKGTYIRVNEKDRKVIKNAEELDIVFLYSESMSLVANNANKYLNLIEPKSFGPPEKCYYGDETNIPLIVHNNWLDGQCVTIPWYIGEHYYLYGYPIYKSIFMGVLRRLLKLKQSYEIKAPIYCEVSIMQQKDGTIIIHMVNNKIVQGMAILQNDLTKNISISFLQEDRPKRIWRLSGSNDIKFEYDGKKTLNITLPMIEEFDSVIVEH